MNFRQPIRALFSDVGSLYALDDRAWKKLGNGKISLIHNAYNPTKVLLSLETDINEFVYQMKPKTKKKGQTWILKGDNTKTNSSDILAVRFSDKHISAYFKKMLEKAAKLKKKHEQKHRRIAHNAHHANPGNNNNIAGPNNNLRHHHRRHHHHAAGDDRDAPPLPISKSEIFKPIYTISWRCPLCKYMNEIGSYKCNICLTPQSDLNIINSTQDQFVEIVNIIQSSLHNNHDKQHKLLNDLIALTKKLMKNDHAHKSLDLNNRDIQENLLSVRGVDQFLSCLGFVEDAPKKKLKCPEDKPHIYAVIAAQSVCKQCINQDAVRQIDEKKKENDGEIGLNKTKILNECNGDIEYCMSVRRVIYVLKYYHEFIALKNANKSTHREGGIYDYLYINNDEDIQFYSNSLLLNDMIHILLHHDNGNQFEQLYNFTIKELGKPCDITSCKIILRNHRDRSVCSADNGQRMNLYFGFNESKEVNTQQIIDKLHCYIMHSYDIGYKLTQDEKNKIKIKENDLSLDMSKLDSILSVKKKENKYVNCSKYNRFIMCMDDNKETEDIYKYPVQDVHVNNGKNMLCNFEKKYRDLKQEMLQNKWCKISNEQWMDLWQKANDFIKCETLINITLETNNNNKDINDDYKHSEDSIEIYHLISILLYCNFERLSYELRCTFHVFEHNKYEFAHWWQILRDTVHRYGMKMTANDRLYYGINREILFHEFQLSFAGTLSVSSEYMIPYLYTNNNGLLLECLDNGMSYFICDFLSDFMYEKEKLFLRNENLNVSYIQIKNIYHMLLHHNYLYGINVIQILLKMIGGIALNAPIGDEVKQIIFKFFKEEKKEIINKKCDINIENDDDKKENFDENIFDYCNDIYYKQMMELHCDKMKEVKINLFLMNIDIHEINRKLFGYLPLKSLFLSHLYESAWINLHLFCDIFKNLQKIYIYNVNISILKSKQKQQKTMNLSRKFLDNLLIFLHEKSNEIALNEIIISCVNESVLSINEAIKIYKKEFMDINWMICSQHILKENDNYKQLIFKRNRMNFNKAKLKQILYENDKEIYKLSIIFEDNESESIIISKSYGDFYKLYDELLNKMNIKFDVVLETNNSKDLTNDLSQFYKELLVKCKDNINDSLLLSKVYNFLIV